MSSWLDLINQPITSTEVNSSERDKEPEKKQRAGIAGQNVTTLNRQWHSDFNRYDEQIQSLELQRHNNSDIIENGIHRKVLSTEDSTLTNDLNRIATNQPFTPAFCKALFSDIHIVFVGDSLARGMYKDLIVLVHTTGGNLSPDDLIKKRLENSWYEDRLLDSSDPEEKTEYMEYREYLKEEHWIQYLFTTRIYNDRVEQLLVQLEENPPDVVVIHSNIWDSTRYAYDDRISLAQFALRLSYLCQRLKQILEPTALVIFVILPPAAYEQTTDRAVKKGFFSFFTEKKIMDMNKMTGFLSSAINYFAAQIVSSYGFDVLDLNYHFQQDTFCALRAPDGLHYTSFGVRIMNQTLIGHIIKAWDVDLPTDISERLEKLQVEYFESHIDELENSENMLDGDFFQNLPDCYKYLLQLNKELYKTLETENSRISSVIKEYREKLLRNMKGFVKNPTLKRYVIDLKSLAKARPADRINKAVTEASFGPKGPKTKLKEIKKMMIDEDDNESVASGASPTRDPELENIFGRFSDDQREFLNKVHLSDALWMELWNRYFNYAAKSLGLATDNTEETIIDSDLEMISDEEDLGTDPISDIEIEPEEVLPMELKSIIRKLFE